MVLLVPRITAVSQRVVASNCLTHPLCGGSVGLTEALTAQSSERKGAPDPDEGRHVRRSAGQRAQHRLRGEVTRCGLLDDLRQLVEDVLFGPGYDLIIVGRELRAYPRDFRPEIALPEGEREAQR